jgi:hypothetical protein
LFLLVEIPFEILEQPPTDRDIDRIATQVIKNSLLFSVHLGIEASFWLELKEDSHKITLSALFRNENQHCAFSQNIYTNIVNLARPQIGLC